MTLLNLKCGGYGIGLHLPATSDKVREVVSRLTEGLDSSAPVHISSVSGSVPEICQYIQRADLRSETDIRKLNLLAERIDGMTQEEQRLFSGALDAESLTGLDDVLRIAGSLGRYELIQGVTSDRELGGWLVEHDRLGVKFPKEVQPYLDYAAIGAEYYASNGGAYSPSGYVKRRDGIPELAEEKVVLRLVLETSGEQFSLGLPASDERLEQVKAYLGLDDFAQAQIVRLEPGPDMEPLGVLLPMDCITVEDANELASCVEDMKQHELNVYFSALSAEGASTFSEALNIALELDDYEAVTDNECEYGREALRRMGADEEVMDCIDGYMDFDRLGRDMMEEDGVRQTAFGLVRRLSKPFPPEQEIGPVMA